MRLARPVARIAAVRAGAGVVLPVTLLAALAVAATPALLGSDERAESARTLAMLVAEAGRLPWPMFGVAVAGVLLVVAHYLLAAVALRTASGARLGLRETVLAQLAAAAANRVVPNGLGGAAVNLRYLLRTGQAPGSAASTLGALGLVGGLADAVFATMVTSVGPLVGLAGGADQVALLATHGMRAGRQVPWPVVVTVVGLVGVVVARRRRCALRGFRAVAGQVGRHLSGLLREPTRLAVMALASAGTTAVLAFAFAGTVVVATGGHQPLPVGGLVTIYLLAAALGGATPLPAVFGATEVALVAALVVSGLPVRIAVIATLVFRLASFWAALPLGILAARRLRLGRLL